MNPTQILQTYFGYNQFRSGQLPIVEALCTYKDVLAMLPTGGGKSICFQVPALCLPGTTLVVSPLISLMMDQVQALQKNGIAAEFLSSQQTPTEQSLIKRRASQGYYKLLYLAPERLTATGVGKWLASFPIPLVIFDEAHCISEWGHDFRPSYRDCLNFIHDLPTRPAIGAFTATATPETQKDICQVLSLHHPQIFKSSFRRHNLWLRSVECVSSTHKVVALGRILQSFWLQPTIIYCSARETTEQISDFLQQTLFAKQPKLVMHYHAKLSPEVKVKTQRDFLEGKVAIMVATTAFGMGVDKPDVRLVIHYHPPPSVESYYQEIGRAGRDGKLSQCFLLYAGTDLKLHQASSKLPSTRTERKLLKLNSMWKIATTYHCRTRAILHYFGENVVEDCQKCDRCLPRTLRASAAEQTTAHKLKTVIKIWRHQLPQPWQDMISQRLITLLAVYRPRTNDELAALPGFGKSLLKLNPPVIHAFSRCYGLSIPQAAHNPRL